MSDLINTEQAAGLLAESRRNRDHIKREISALESDLKKVEALIGALEAFGAAPEPPRAALLVEATQYQAWRANAALKHLMLGAPRAFRAREYANALANGGLATEAGKIFANIKNYLKAWRAEGLVRYHEADQTWELTEKGRSAFSGESDAEQSPLLSFHG